MAANRRSACASDPITRLPRPPDWGFWDIETRRSCQKFENWRHKLGSGPASGPSPGSTVIQTMQALRRIRKIPKDMTGPKCLIVEDEYLIRLTLAEALVDD